MSLQSIETSSASFPLQLLHILEEISHRVANEYAEAIAELRFQLIDGRHLPPIASVIRNAACSIGSGHGA